MGGSQAELAARPAVDRRKPFVDLALEFPVNGWVQADFKAVVLQADAGEGRQPHQGGLALLRPQWHIPAQGAADQRLFPGLQKADPRLQRVITWRPPHLTLAR